MVWYGVKEELQTYLNSQKMACEGEVWDIVVGHLTKKNAPIHWGYTALANNTFNL